MAHPFFVLGEIKQSDAHQGAGQNDMEEFSDICFHLVPHLVSLKVKMAYGNCQTSTSA